MKWDDEILVFKTKPIAQDARIFRDSETWFVRKRQRHRQEASINLSIGRIFRVVCSGS